MSAAWTASVQAVAPRVPHKYHLLVGEGERATVHVPYEYLGRSARHSHWSGLTLSVLEIIRLGASDWQENAEDRPIRTALPTFFDLRQAIFGTSHQTGATTVWHAACTVHICVVQLYTPRLHIFRQFR